MYVGPQLLHFCSSLISFLDFATTASTGIGDPFFSFFGVLEAVGLATGLFRVFRVSSTGEVRGLELMYFESSLVVHCCKYFISFLDSAMALTTTPRDPFVSYFHVLEDTGLAALLFRVSSA